MDQEVQRPLLILPGGKLVENWWKTAWCFQKTAPRGSQPQLHGPLLGPGSKTKELAEIMALICFNGFGDFSLRPPKWGGGSDPGAGERRHQRGRGM